VTRRAADEGDDKRPAGTLLDGGDEGARGLDAVNFGPGATSYAHRRDERVEVAELVRSYEALARFAGGSV